jgi:TolB protein
MPFHKRFTVHSGQNPTQRVVLRKRVFAPAKLIVPCDRTGNAQLYLMNPDGSAPVQLTKFEKGNSSGSTWSPDGKQIAFLASPTNDKTHVYVMNVADQTVRQLTIWAWNDAGVDWSVDGQLVIASEQDGKGVLYVMKADGSNQPTKLTPDGAEDLYPAWSPDGKKIAFASKRDGHQGFGLYLMDADGKNPRQIMKTDGDASCLAAAWHPDGKRIAYTESVGQALEIFLIDLDGSNKKQVTHLGGANGASAWNPDGKQLAFLHDNKMLYLLNTDGNDPPRKILEEKVIARPVWRPRQFLGD